eukprot:gene12284-25837_t
MTEEVPVKDWCRVRVPDTCRGVDIVIGIDEAGRGPVLGSLIYCAAFWPVSENESIIKLGFDDSKVLSEATRDSIFERISAHPSIGWVIEELDAKTISKEMLRIKPVSLNALSYNAVVRMLETIRDAGDNPPVTTDIFVDTVGDPEFYKSWLQRALGNDFARFIIEKKADAKYPVVSAASIIAKVTRDRLLREWKYEESGSLTTTLDKNFGSGYPGDDTCVQWLDRAYHPIFGFPSLARHSWSTCRDFIVKKGGVEVK